MQIQEGDRLFDVEGDEYVVLEIDYYCDYDTGEYDYNEIVDVRMEYVETGGTDWYPYDIVVSEFSHSVVGPSSNLSKPLGIVEFWRKIEREQGELNV